MIPTAKNTITRENVSYTIGSTTQLPTAILLAGGLSTRMGCCKQLLPLCGKPLIEYVIETLLEAGLTHLVITVNAETQQPITEMTEHLAQNQWGQNESLKEPAAGSETFRPFHCDIVFNPEPERGQGHSAALAVQAACRGYAEGFAATANTSSAYTPSGFLFCTADQPFLQADSIRDLCSVFRRNSGSIVSAAFNGRHCSPVIFPAVLANELSCLDGSIGGRTVMNAHPDLILYSPLRSEMEAFDIDTPEDFKRAEEYVQQHTQDNCTEI
ncbi:NTP transferase domain-containing protein [Treponema sp. OMZ 857]|uniref:nucleotidyltransferase family protein n=1 Tax=Treponema sp. OMZ 857 TaxID=1643513 RepID=UPI0020A43144|nr:nucleotidyltransferase family protein [Treponema sp. OMZ 857]UTC44413.1 nucleotidyltransferase family protein [Treponema sp. OMZ 857]